MEHTMKMMNMFREWQEDKSKLHLVYKWANGDELSTILLPPIYPSKTWESCLFYADSGSQVLNRYYSEDEARAGHEQLIVEYSR